MPRRLPLVVAAVAALVAVCSGCGGGSGSGAGTNGPSGATATPATQGGLGALQAEATAVASGDIPDNQVFLTFQDATGGFSIKYPEGWAQSGSGKRVTLRDKNNIVRIVIGSGVAPTAGGVKADMAALKGATPTAAAQQLTISGKPAFKVTYSTVSAPNPVTGKRVTLAVDRYYLWQGGRTAVVDLGTPVGVDNVDAYRMMIESFRWR